MVNTNYFVIKYTKGIVFRYNNFCLRKILTNGRSEE
jgi:hypothetical protein